MKPIKLMPFHVESVQEQAVEMGSGVRMIKATDIWNKAKRGKGVVVAIIDTGCQMDHPDLKKQIIGGRNFTAENKRDPADYSDTNGHGTHVAGIIASNNPNKILGVAPEASLLIVKALNSDGSGGMTEMLKAIQYAISWRGKNKERVRVISMSLGSTRDNPYLHRAIKQAVDANILVICAAGNHGDGNPNTEEKSYPGAYSEVIEVGAVDANKKMADFSNTNQEIDLVAPGVDILSTYLDAKYATMSGTSMAAPHVAGAAALIINQCEQDFSRSLSEAEIYAQICKRTQELGYTKQEEGNGLLMLTAGYGY